MIIMKSKPSKKNLRDFLNLLREREHWSYGYEPEEEEQEIWNPLSPDEWQEFKRKFVSHYGGEKVQADGLTHSEFLRYLKNGYREGDEFVEEEYVDILDLIRQRQKR